MSAFDVARIVAGSVAVYGAIVVLRVRSKLIPIDLLLQSLLLCTAAACLISSGLIFLSIGK